MACNDVVDGGGDALSRGNDRGVLRLRRTSSIAGDMIQADGSLKIVLCDKGVIASLKD